MVSERVKGHKIQREAETLYSTTNNEKIAGQ
ncbi:MAG: hypothetical protein Ta2E_00860 [Mycoplasmoidaceae bacterium]|nr:MAG: hypothetical protein Ta2E_00860 [Mycoplasmoidaceae bacterium]